MSQLKIKTPNITAYNQAMNDTDRPICELLCQEITKALPNSSSKIWHGHPVWFLENNPVAGYSKLKTSVRLLFWSGQSFDEPNLYPEGSFKAAEIRYTLVDQINILDLRRWLQKCRDVQWDYKQIVKRRGQLIRLK